MLSLPVAPSILFLRYVPKQTLTAPRIVTSSPHKIGNQIKKGKDGRKRSARQLFDCSPVVRSVGRHTKIPLTCLRGRLSGDSKL